MKNPISITSVSTISALGSSEEEIWNNYKNQQAFFQNHDFEGNKALAAFLSEDIKKQIEKLRSENSRYRYLDDSVLYAVLAARNLEDDWTNAGINIGSSRGATGLFEKYHAEYIKSGKASTYTSPSTTLGNISSWVAQDLQIDGPNFSHSVTCSTGMHGILNAIAWLESGMADSFIAGGSEAPLTGFTIAQMKAMKIYAQDENAEFPCRSLDMEKKMNSMILGEAAGLVGLSLNSEKSVAKIKGIGFANENLTHGASLSKEGECLQKSMKMALKNAELSEVDAVVMHAPGTIGGDSAEVNAVKAIFDKKLPGITSNKWKTGHNFAASGILSLQMAILMLKHQEFIPVPFSQFQQKPEKLDNIMVNSVGFGGNAVSIIVGM